MAKSVRVCMEIFTTALTNKKYSQISNKIPLLTSTVHRLLSDRLLCWKEPILASYPFLINGQITGTLGKKGEVFYVRFDYVFFIPRSGRKYSHTNSYNFATTLISQDDHLTAGSWVTCAQTKIPDSRCLTSLRIKCSYYSRLRVRVRLSASLRSAASSCCRGSF